MKNKILYTCLCFVLLSAQCKKSKQPNTDTPGLPPATQIGANTFGCLVNGVPWLPQGNNGGGNNLSIYYDPLFNNGVFDIAAYNAVISPTSTQYIGIGVADSLNYFNFPKTLKLSKTSIYRATASISLSCIIVSTATIVSEGELFIDKLDKQNRIIAGRFNYTLYQSGCDTIKITNGRFDMKF
ncbi:MAG: hypothetical protein K2X48_06370 [Chitinophagaceae bacterium]|nr:hypothetical protein [Chitinophagaceae bacterium]